MSTRRFSLVQITGGALADIVARAPALHLQALADDLGECFLVVGCKVQEHGRMNYVSCLLAADAGQARVATEDDIRDAIALAEQNGGAWGDLNS